MNDTLAALALCAGQLLSPNAETELQALYNSLDEPGIDEAMRSSRASQLRDRLAMLQSAGIQLPSLMASVPAGAAATFTAAADPTIELQQISEQLEKLYPLTLELGKLLQKYRAHSHIPDGTAVTEEMLLRWIFTHSSLTHQSFIARVLDYRQIMNSGRIAPVQTDPPYDIAPAPIRFNDIAMQAMHNVSSMQAHLYTQELITHPLFLVTPEELEALTLQTLKLRRSELYNSILERFSASPTTEHLRAAARTKSSVVIRAVLKHIHPNPAAPPAAAPAPAPTGFFQRLTAAFRSPDERPLPSVPLTTPIDINAPLINGLSIAHYMILQAWKVCKENMNEDQRSTCLNKVYETNRTLSDLLENPGFCPRFRFIDSGGTTTSEAYERLLTVAYTQTISDRTGSSGSFIHPGSSRVALLIPEEKKEVLFSLKDREKNGL